MTVLMLNTYDDVGGAARAAGRLLRGVRDLGVEARLQVHIQTGATGEVDCPAGRFRQQARRLKMLLGALPVRRYPKAPEFNFTPALLPDHLLPDIAAADPDIVHLHWLGAGFLRIESLGRIGRPLIWTLHDSWPFTGGCHVPFDCTRYRQRCGACPILGSARDNDLSRRVWARKDRSWRDLDLTLVAPSRWLAEAARSSALFRETRVEVIPNGLDLERFRPVDKSAARQRLDLPKDGKVILFGGVRAVTDPNKGWHLLVPALQQLGRERSDLMALAFNAFDHSDFPAMGLPLQRLGQIHDDETLAHVYAAADVFVVPSIQEAFCQTAVEAMACGTPVVAFGATGLLDVVEHRRSGYLAEPYESAALADGISWVLADPTRYRQLSRCAREKVETDFTIRQVAQRYADLYRSVGQDREPGHARR